MNEDARKKPRTSAGRSGPRLIRPFRRRDTAAICRDQDPPRFHAIERVARRGLYYPHAATRICFAWREGEAHDVEIVDYH
ncbi:MAG: hypothetical protein LC126_24760 [Bryobacterales bacterium]|nr:hypothetical protein [Bryobacterales bacterium]